MLLLLLLLLLLNYLLDWKVSISLIKEYVPGFTFSFLMLAEV